MFVRRAAGPFVIFMIFAMVFTVSVVFNARLNEPDTPVLPPVNPVPVQTPLWPDGAPNVIVGDSTASLGEDAPVPESLNGCTHSEDAWPSLLRVDKRFADMADLSCAGARTSRGLKDTDGDLIGHDTSRVFIAYGSNDIALARKKASRDPVGVRRALDRMVDNVSTRAPDATVYLVGYLKFDLSGCSATTKRSRAISNSHATVNEQMMAVASSREDVVYVAPPVIPGVCDKDGVIVRPGEKRGTVWHNSSKAHRLVSRSIVSAVDGSEKANAHPAPHPAPSPGQALTGGAPSV